MYHYKQVRANQEFILWAKIHLLAYTFSICVQILHMKRITNLPKDIYYNTTLKQQPSFYLHDHQDATLEAALARIQGFLLEGQTLTTSHDSGRKFQQAGSEEPRKMLKLSHHNSSNRIKKFIKDSKQVNQVQLNQLNR